MGCGVGVLGEGRGSGGCHLDNGEVSPAGVRPVAARRDCIVVIALEGTRVGVVKLKLIDQDVEVRVRFAFSG